MDKSTPEIGGNRALRQSAHPTLFPTQVPCYGPLLRTAVGGIPSASSREENGWRRETVGAG